MKKLLIVAVFGIILFVSCGSETTLADAQEDAARVYCEKLFTCDEGIAARPMFGGTEAKCREAMLALMEQEANDDPCTNFNADKADECSTCSENLSCSETFPAEEDVEDPCPVCDQVCD
ncbi:MAG TPA: hypothetical protein PLW78_03885 [bacterium]|nr:hypothetical protein [bacterium]HPG36532.1 hypothetical protein [bacterium]HPM45818.1 hypothetical protein [bacterium]HPV21145.1 hypothetical protein [bacterium]HRQ69426.1 hypothetical protein [bacterium]